MPVISGSLTLVSGSFTSDNGSIALSSSALQSIPNSSGDGLGASTLELIPDNTLGTDQYVVLDPTSPNHIHVRAGGVIDESTAYLYLGGEKANVLVDDFSHQVQINTTAADSSSFGWTFGNDGTLTLPDLLQLPVRSTDPLSPAEGMIMSSGSAGSSKLYYYNGSAWVDLTA